jgi:hypothetical protein
MLSIDELRTRGHEQRLGVPGQEGFEIGDRRSSGQMLVEIRQIRRSYPTDPNLAQQSHSHAQRRKRIESPVAGTKERSRPKGCQSRFPKADTQTL